MIPLIDSLRRAHAEGRRHLTIDEVYAGNVIRRREYEDTRYRSGRSYYRGAEEMERDVSRKIREVERKQAEWQRGGGHGAR